MKTNILQAISNIIEKSYIRIDDYKTLKYQTRINNNGEAFENLIKDALCNNFNQQSDKRELHNQFFSYLGNQNNPPDLIIRGGDAFEIKKIGNNNDIALNSSFPKEKLYRNSNMINSACKNCEENWVEKDICYVIGNIDKNSLIKNLWFVYGDCYCASPRIYERLKDKITKNIHELGIELSSSNEIARVNKVDPLGITYLRVRGMWGIKNPSKVFEYIITKSTPHIRALMLKEKYYSFDINSRNDLSKKCEVKEVRIKDPNNPAKLLDAILIEYEFKL
jgi:hypothetical protein